MVDRLESMSSDGFLRLTIEDDGDVIIFVHEQFNGAKTRFASVQFCTAQGGGGSPETFLALRALAIAMAKDNANSMNPHRRGDFPGAELLADAQYGSERRRESLEAIYDALGDCDDHEARRMLRRFIDVEL